MTFVILIPFGMKITHCVVIQSLQLIAIKALRVLRPPSAIMEESRMNAVLVYYPSWLLSLFQYQVPSLLDSRDSRFITRQEALNSLRMRSY